MRNTNRIVAGAVMLVQVTLMHPWMAYGEEASESRALPRIPAREDSVGCDGTGLADFPLAPGGAEPAGASAASELVAMAPVGPGPVATDSEEAIAVSAPAPSASALIRAAEGGVIRLPGAEIEIPAGALGADTEIRVTRLSGVAETGEELRNATAGGGGWRFEPAGTTFAKPATIKMGYEPELDGNETALSNLYTYFYDTKNGTWERLERVGFDHEKRQVVSQTTHFTDMINATLTLPEGPAPLSFNINSIKSLEAANPSAGVAKIEGLEGNARGNASFGIALELPAGRAGMQPRVSVTYSSDGGAGLCGKGFDVQAGSSVSIDTRRGLPAYLYPTSGKTDTYLLDGIELAVKGGSGDATEFYPLSEKGFAKIERHTDGGVTYWTVTEKNGTEKTYGLRNNSWAGRSSTERNIWYLDREMDVWGNTVQYTYERSKGAVYLTMIAYTGRGEDAGPYTVTMRYRDDRLDARIDGRGGYTAVHDKLLSEVAIAYNGQEIRTYKFGYGEGNAYEPNVFGVTELRYFAQTKGTEEFYRYEFAYAGLEKDENGVYAFFGEQKDWNLKDGLQVQQGAGIGVSVSGSAGVGVGFKSVDVRVSGGLQGSWGTNTQRGKQTLVDIDGDGRPDSVKKVAGGIEVSFNEGNGFGTSQFIGLDVDSIDSEESTNTTTGWNANGGVGVGDSVPISGSVNYSKIGQDGTTSSKRGFCDIDGDGRADLAVSGESYYYWNTGELSNLFVKTPLVTSSAVEEEFPVLSDEKKAEYDASFFVQAPVRSWRAPYTGTITVRQVIEPVRDTVSADGVTARMYVSASEAPTEVVHVSSTSRSRQERTTTLRVAAGDEIFFVIDPHMDTRGDDLEWQVAIRYASVQRVGGIDSLFVFMPKATMTTSEMARYELEALKEIYKYLRNPNQSSEYYYKLESEDWVADAGDQIDAVREALIAQRRFVPGRIDVADFNVLRGKISRLPIPEPGPSESRMTDDEWKLHNERILFASYIYDAADGYFYRNTTAADNFIIRLVEECTDAEIEGFRTYQWIDGSANYVSRTRRGKAVRNVVGNQTAITRRVDGTPGYVGANGGYLVLDTVDGRLWTLDIGTGTVGTVKRDGVPFVNATHWRSGNAYTISVPIYDGASLVYQQDYQFGNFHRIAAELTKAELQAIRDRMQETSGARPRYDIRSDRWTSPSYESIRSILDRCASDGDRTIFFSAFDRHEPAQPEPPAAAVTYTDEECTYTRKEPLSDGEVAAINAVLDAESWRAFLTDEFPFYAIAGNGSYTLRSGWDQDISGDELTELENEKDPRYEQYCTLLAMNAAFSYGSWGSLVKSISYYADGEYTVAEQGDTITVMELRNNAFASVTYAVTTWDSGADFSTEDIVKSPVTYTEEEEVEEGGEIETVEYGVETRELFYGGVNRWYYGIWLGNQQTKNPFSKERLSSNYEENANITKDEINAKKASLETTDPESPEGVGVEVLYQKTTLLSAYDYLTSGITEQDTGREIERDSGALVGTVNTVVRNTITDNADGSTNLVPREERYCPFVSGNIVHANRAGGSAYYEIPGIMGGGGSEQGGYVGPLTMVSLRKSQSDAVDVTKGLSIDVGLTSSISGLTDAFMSLSASGSLTNGTNDGKSKMLQGVQDINGDGYADIITVKGGDIKVVPGGVSGFGKAYVITGASVLNAYTNNTKSVGVSPSSSGSVTVKYTAKGTTAGITMGSGFGISTAKGTCGQTAGLSDINGDGLPDSVREGTVYLNLGSTFEQANAAEIEGWTGTVLSSGNTRSVGMSISISKAKTKVTDYANGMNTKTSFSPAGSVSYSVNMTRTGELLIDVNGDGLPDKVSKSATDSYVLAYINLGTKFSQTPLKLSSAGWSLGPSDKDKFIYITDGSLLSSAIDSLPIVGSLVNKTGIGDYMGDNGKALNPLATEIGSYINQLEANTGYNAGVNGSFNGNVTVSIPIFMTPFKINITGAAGAGLNASASLSGISSRMMDIDGDGFVDRVVRVPGKDGKLLVQRNLSGRVGLLAEIRLPQGGSYTFEYARAGSPDEIDYLAAGNTPKHPQSKYVLKAVTLSDGNGEAGMLSLPGEHEYRTEYFYEEGYYDRDRKEFYGYERVTTRFADRSEREVVYENEEYHAKGMPRRVIARDENGNVLREQTMEIDEAPYARVTQETTTQREKTMDEPLTRTVRYEYYGDDWGNVSRIEDESPEGTLVAEIDYWNEDNGYSTYLHAHPSEIRVYDGVRLVRRRSASYQRGTGALESLTRYYTEGAWSTTTIEWDDYGNLERIEDPRGAYVAYEYDDVLHQYPSVIRRGGRGVAAYESSIEWDAARAVKVAETDENGNRMAYEYDDFCRLWRIWSPKELAVSNPHTPAVSYQYVTDAGHPWYALTENKILFDPEDPAVMSTVVAVDGLGRASLTAKTGEMREGGGRRYGWNVSGFRSYDTKGRPVAEGQNRFIENGNPANVGVDVEALLAADYRALTRPTTTEYDALDRPITVTLPKDPLDSTPGGVTSSMQYGIASGAAYTIAIDPLTNWSRREVDARGNVRFEGRYDAKSNTILTSARYEYNALGELLVAYDHQGNPLTVEYDLAGRRTAIETKDAGRKEYHYDEADNLVRETDNVLRGRGESIAYEYDGMNRLLTIDYPRSADTGYVYGEPDARDNRAGRVVSVTDESGTIVYTYGSLGETTSEERRITRLTPGYQGSPESARMTYEGDYLGRMQRITYPDNEVVTYGYDRGGQIKSVTGRRFTTDFNYVVDVAYDEYGQRSYIEYGNGVHTTYVYDAYRRWLKSIATEYAVNGNSIEYQNIVYQFDAVGNVLGYENKTNRYETSQTYTYDALYQLKTANGRTVNRSEGLGSCPAYTSTYKQIFEFDSIGNMTKKVSTSAVSPKRTIGAGLNYNYDQYDYYAGFPHRLERVGNMYYRYDGNGNVIAEREGGHATTDSRNATVYNDGDLYYTDYGFGLFQEGQTDTKVYERKYTWNERNLLSSSVDRQYAVTYRYGADGQRAVKYAVRGTTSVETMYFNQFWSSRTTATSEMLESKHIFVGTSRVVTKLHRKGDDSVDYEGKNRYYYHSDHLGSAQLVTDFKGLEYERIEYTPYGELWVEKTIAGSERLPFRFTGKEFDEETGLYYYGARYLDPKVSRWLSTDPAVGEYIPSAPVNDEARKRNGNLPGMGGIYNLVNFHLYHYAGNNPVRYIDPDGRESAEDANKRVAYVEAQRKHQEMNQIGQLSSGTASWLMQHTPWNSAPLGTSDTVGAHGCKATGAAKIASSMTGMNITPDIMASYADSSGNLSQEAISKAISDYSDKPVITDYWEKGLNADRLSKIRNNPSGKVFILARVTLGGGLGEHWVVLQDYMLNSDGIIHYLVNGTSVNDYGTVDNGGAARIFTSGSNDNSARKGTVNKIETYQQ